MHPCMPPKLKALKDNASHATGKSLHMPARQAPTRPTNYTTPYSPARDQHVQELGDADAEAKNSPTIHFSSCSAMPGGEELMKSEVHHSGVASSSWPNTGMTFGKSVVQKLCMKLANFSSPGP